MIFKDIFIVLISFIIGGMIGIFVTCMAVISKESSLKLDKYYRQELKKKRR